MIRKSKRAFILLEVIISITLLVALLSILNFFYYKLALLNTLQDQLLEEQFSERHLNTRLSSIFSTVHPKTDNIEKFLFESDGESVLFYFYNGYLTDKKRSSLVKGKIFLEDAHLLVLHMWPIDQEEEDPYREVLEEGVDEVKFSFYIPPKQKKIEFPASLPKETAGETLKYWKKDYNVLPQFIVVSIKQGEKSKELTIPMAGSLFFPIYGSD